MQDKGVGSWPLRRARRSPDRVALVHEGRRTTYAELDRDATDIAVSLLQRGIRTGDRVAYLGLNSATFVRTMIAVAKLGAVFVPLNTRHTAAETGFVLTDSEARLLIGTSSFRDMITEEPVAALEVAQVNVDELCAESAREKPLDTEVGLDDLFMIQYTSGTSGRPKGVELTHGNITWNVYNLLADVDVLSDEVALVTAPLFHTAALNQLLLPTLLKGGTAIVESSFDAERCLELIERDRVTFLFGVTSMYQSLAASPGWNTRDLSSLRTALSGGAPIPESLLHTWEERGLHIVQGYGLTEAAPGVTMLGAGADSDKLGSAGTACFFADVRVVSADLHDVEVGASGEVLVEGPNVTAGYWNQPSATREAFVDGSWLRTGDVATVDHDGFLTIVGRVKDMFISGGENVYPAEVEGAIYSHPGVAECAVIGISDERWGEVGLAVIVRRDESLDESSLLEHLASRLARYKLPKSFRFVEELPHTASGKLAKAQVSKLYGSESR